MLHKVKLKMEDLKSLLKEKHSFYNKEKIRLEKEYQLKKEKLLQRKYEIKSKLANLTREATGWLEPMRDLIVTCNSVGKIIKEDNRFELRQICQKAGSNFKLSRRKLSFSFSSPFDLIEIHKNSVGELSHLNTAKPKNSELLITDYLINSAVLSEWWRWGDSNPRPVRCERTALPSELHPHIIWLTLYSN